MHGYLGLVPGHEEPAQTPAVGFAPPEAAPAPASAPDPAAATTAALESLLLRFGLVSSDQLGQALREHAETGRHVGAIVVERGWVSAADIERLTGTPVTVAPAPAPAPTPAFEAPAPFPKPVLELEDPPAPVFRVIEAEPVFEAPTVEVEPEPFPAVAIEAAPEPEFPSVAPIVPFQGTFTPMDEPEIEPAAEPAAVTLPEPEPAPIVPFEVPAAPEPVLPFQLPVEPAASYTPFHSEQAPTPPAVPLHPPVTQPAPAAAPEQPSVKHLVIARLTTGERVEVNSYADRNAARAEAKALMAYLREGHPDWPFVNGRFIRPEAIVSIDLETVLLS